MHLFAWLTVHAQRCSNALHQMLVALLCNVARHCCRTIMPVPLLLDSKPVPLALQQLLNELAHHGPHAAHSSSKPFCSICGIHTGASFKEVGRGLCSAHTSAVQCLVTCILALQEQAVDSVVPIMQHAFGSLTH